MGTDKLLDTYDTLVKRLHSVRGFVAMVYFLLNPEGIAEGIEEVPLATLAVDERKSLIWQFTDALDKLEDIQKLVKEMHETAIGQAKT